MVSQPNFNADLVDERWGRVDIAGQYEGAVSQPRDAGLISAGIDVQDADGAGI